MPSIDFLVAVLNSARESVPYAGRAQKQDVMKMVADAHHKFQPDIHGLQNQIVQD